MSINQLFDQPYFNQLYESMKHLKLQEIKNLCQSDKKISDFCRDNVLLQQLIAKKSQDAIADRIDQYIEEGGRQGRSGANLNYAFDQANQKGDVEVIKELLKTSVAGIDPYNIARAADSPGHPEILALLLKSPKLVDFVRPYKLGEYNLVYTYLRSMEYLDYDNIAKICSGNTKLFQMCKSSPYVQKLIKQRKKEKDAKERAEFQYYDQRVSEHPEELLQQAIKRYLKDGRVWGYLTPEERDIYLQSWENLTRHEKEEYLRKLQYIYYNIVD